MTHARLTSPPINPVKLRGLWLPVDKTVKRHWVAELLRGVVTAQREGEAGFAQVGQGPWRGRGLGEGQGAEGIPGRGTSRCKGMALGNSERAGEHSFLDSNQENSHSPDGPYHTLTAPFLDLSNAYKIHSSHPSHEHIWSNCCMPGTVLDTRLQPCTK